jgi:hypothetical protein
MGVGKGSYRGGAVLAACRRDDRLVHGPNIAANEANILLSFHIDSV